MTATIETLNAQLQELQINFLKSVETITSAINEIQEEQKKQDDVLAPFSAFLMVELTPYFGGKDAKKIVDKLARCREVGDYRYFIPMYKMVGDDLEKRQLLKLIRAAYQFKFGGYRSTEKYDLKSTIKYAKACPECGKLANRLYNRMVKEGLW